MFYDLNIRKQDTPNWESSALSVVERLVKFGYRGFAITTEVDESILQKSKKEKESKKKNSEPAETSFIPTPPDLKNFRNKFPKFKFYNRINIVVNESNNLKKFTQCKELKKYDLISFQPESNNALKTLSSVAEVDIISYNPENKFDLTFNRKMYNQFLQHNIFFELTYASAIIDSTLRRNLISLSHIYRAIGKSKNIIVTSGASTAAHGRGPYDVINFNLLFGLSEEQSKNSISRNCEKLLLRARKQRRNKSTVEMVLKPEPTEENAMDVDSIE